MILITGSSGFIGRHLLNNLQNQSVMIRCLVRSAVNAEWVRSFGFDAARGDITDPSSLENAFDGVDTVVHLVGILEEKDDIAFEHVHVKGTENLVNRSLQSGVERFFFQSALGADSNSPFNYMRTKALAEKTIMSSGIPCTIFRPSLIVGEGDGFTKRVKQLLSAGPVVPVPGDGHAKVQPLYIDDWIRCFLKIMKNGTFSGQTYSLGGPEQLSYNNIFMEMMRVLDIRKRIVHIPITATRMSLPFMGIVNSLAGAFGKQIPAINGELLSLLTIDNVCDIDSVQKQFGFEPVRFSEVLKNFIAT